MSIADYRLILLLPDGLNGRLAQFFGSAEGLRLDDVSGGIDGHQHLHPPRYLLRGIGYHRLRKSKRRQVGDVGLHWSGRFWRRQGILQKRKQQ